MSQRSSLTDGAAAMGRQRGRDAAAWVFDGTTSAGIQDYALMFIGTGCEPLLSDGWPRANLAGDADIQPRSEDPGDAAGAYQEAAREAFWDELERLCRIYLTDAG